jgi:hypothetical protein
MKNLRPHIVNASEVIEDFFSLTLIFPDQIRAAVPQKLAKSHEVGTLLISK